MCTWAYNKWHGSFGYSFSKSFKGSYSHKRGQVIAKVYICEAQNIKEVHSIGDLNELGLPHKEGGVHTLINVEKFANLNSEEKEIANNLFPKYRKFFASSDTDLGLAKYALHKIYTCNAEPVKVRAIRRSKAEEAIAEVKIRKNIRSWASSTISFSLLFPINNCKKERWFKSCVHRISKVE